MKIMMTDDPAAIRIGDEEAVIFRQDVENAKLFAREVGAEKNAKLRREWEMDYYKSVKEQYNAKVAGALLAKVWEWTGKAAA